MITRLQEWFETCFESRWFQGLLVGSVIYAAIWFYVLPRQGLFDVLAYLAVGLWAAVLTVVLGSLGLAIGRGIKEHFLAWDGHERRSRERGRGAAAGGLR